MSTALSTTMNATPVEFNIPHFISKWNIIGQYTFERMLESYEGERFVVPETGERMTYEDFIIWNNTCISNMTQNDRLILQSFGNMIKNGKFKIMDEESCVAFTATEIYIDMDSKICIVNPR